MHPDRIQFVETEYGRLAYQLDGSGGDGPAVLLQRFCGMIDHWDPASISTCFASSRHPLRIEGVGRAQGQTPESVAEHGFLFQ